MAARIIWVLVAAVTAMLVAGCAGPTSASRAEYISANPHVAPHIRDAIARGAIVTGMSKDDVIAAWGHPCSYCIGTRSASWGDRWEYNPFGSARPGAGTYVYFDSSDRVRSWSGR